MSLSLVVAVLLLGVLAVQAVPAPLVSTREDITTLSPAQISSYKPYTYFASTANCQPKNTLTWICGANCDANPGFQTVASGGDGAGTQFWFVGFDPSLNSIIVSHQGTDIYKIFPILTDVDVVLSCLDSDLFPGLSSDIKVHMGFRNEQAITAKDVLSAVNTGLKKHGATHVTIVGHSLGAAIALLDAVYLPLHLPAGTTFKYVGYGLPRVGNQHFADYVDAHLQDLTHINNKEDPVPVVPPRFMGFHHPSGEVHIQDSGEWVSCSGQDNESHMCSAGDVRNPLVGNRADHSGPYDGVMMGC